jgi:UPF0755 protein
MMKKVIKIMIIILGGAVVFSLIAAVIGVALAIQLNKPPAQTRGEVFFEVKQGETPRSIGRRLEEEGLIKSRFFWYMVNKFDTDFLKAGAYTIKMPATQFEIHNLLETGQQILVKITIPEGGTLKKTAALFEEAGICGAEDFLNAVKDKEILAEYEIPAETMEGYLFPDTYLFQENYPAEKVARIMAETFFKRLAPIAQIDALTPQEVFEKVTLASIVEREYRIADEAPLMAGVFFNRLKINMALQSCATVEYVLTEIQGKPHPETLYTRDTEIKNPYNTYINKGLPPGPICSPGQTALSAVFNPTPSDYLYFRLVDPSAGRHYFSKTFDDHIKAGKLYVKK